MARHLAYCQSCDNILVVETNGHGVVIAYEVIPDSTQAEAMRRRLERPHSDLFGFGTCFKCKDKDGKKRTGWPLHMNEVGFRGLP